MRGHNLCFCLEIRKLSLNYLCYPSYLKHCVTNQMPNQDYCNFYVLTLANVLMYSICNKSAGYDSICCKSAGNELNDSICYKSAGNVVVVLLFMFYVGWLVVLGLTALQDSISVYIGPSPREREKETRKDR